MILRPYQVALKAAIYTAWAAYASPQLSPTLASWQTVNAVCAVAPTGAGKTTTFASLVHEHNGASIVVAHRHELIQQMSSALAREGVRHRIIGANSLIKFIVQEHIREFGRSWFDPNARCAVAGIDTLVNRADELRNWLPQVTLGIMDEGHHVLRKNKWGKGIAMLPNARWVLFTATPVRADGHGLGILADGVCSSIVEGPSMRSLIDDGYLTDYDLYCPPSDIDLAQVPISDATGDFVHAKLVKATKAAKQLVGDVVATYLKNCSGKRTVVFAVDVEEATKFAAQFNASGIRAEVVSGNTEAKLRNEIIRQFRRGEITVLCNCDLFGEGFDLPAIECVIMARGTHSFPLYCQQFGRALRPFYAEGFDLSTREGRLAAIAASIKPRAIIFDHVGNSLTRHGLPDRPRVWSLGSRERRSQGASDAIPLRPCVECTQPYERFRDCCPHCGHVPEISARGMPEFVDGDLTKCTPEFLAAARGAIAAVDRAPADVARAAVYASAGSGANPQAIAGRREREHHELQEAQGALRSIITWYAGLQRAHGLTDTETYRHFYLSFGCDILTAQSLRRQEAFTLADRINRYLGSAVA